MILQKDSNTEKPKGMHKRVRTSSTELVDVFNGDPIIVTKQEGPPLDHVLIVNYNTTLENHPPMEKILNKPTLVFSSTEQTTLSREEEEEVSLIDQTEGFESGFETFGDFLNYSSSRLEEEEEQRVKSSTKSKLKLKLKKVKTNLKTCFQVKKQLKRIYKNSSTILRAIGNITALLFRGALLLTINAVIVFTIILSLAMI